MKKAFTLIELLVVIAIIAILAAILFPVFAQAKAAAKKAAALSNLKQNATAVQIYLADSDDVYPQSAYCAVGCAPGPGGLALPAPGAQIYSIYDALMPYTKNRDIFTDPAEPQAINWITALQNTGLNLLPFLNGGTVIANSQNVINFAGSSPNFALFEDPGIPPTLGANDGVRPATIVEFPAETSMFFTAKYVRTGTTNPEADPTRDPSQNGVQANLRALYLNPQSPISFGKENFPGTARHNGQLVVNFADGHARTYRFNAQIGQNLLAPDPVLGGGALNRVYNLPYDLNGIPGIIAEPTP